MVASTIETLLKISVERDNELDFPLI
jgi:hypothetical protein